VTSSLGELVENVEPVTVLLVNALTADLDLDGLDKAVANPVSVGVSASKRWERNLDVHTVDEITVARDGARHLLAEVSRTVEGLVDGFAREVRVASVDDLEERNLGVSRKINILRPVCDELKKTATHFLYIMRKKIQENKLFKIHLYALRKKGCARKRLRHRIS
jgi:hypothetical protein